jgi:hypothetical protein
VRRIIGSQWVQTPRHRDTISLLRGRAGGNRCADKTNDHIRVCKCDGQFRGKSLTLSGGRRRGFGGFTSSWAMSMRTARRDELMMHRALATIQAQIRAKYRLRHRSIRAGILN